MFVRWWIVISGSCWVTLVIAFRFLPQTFGRWRGTTNRYFVICHSVNARLVVGTLRCGGDTQSTRCNQINWTFCTQRGSSKFAEKVLEDVNFNWKNRVVWSYFRTFCYVFRKGRNILFPVKHCMYDRYNHVIKREIARNSITLSNKIYLHVTLIKYHDLKITSLRHEMSVLVCKQYVLGVTHLTRICRQFKI